jgi:neurofibromin 1
MTLVLNRCVYGNRPQIELLYNKSSDLRAMFIETLNRVTQGYTMHTPLKMIPSITLKEKV